MIDRLQGFNIQDLAYSTSLGIDKKEVEELSLFHQRIDLLKKYWEMQEENKTLTKVEADKLDNKFWELTMILENEYDKDFSCDYIANFNSLVK